MNDSSQRPADDEDEDNTCRDCGVSFAEGDDGYDGLCGDCADINEGDEPDQPEEDSYQTGDYTHWSQYGRPITLETDPDNWEFQLKQHADRAQFWPNAFYIDDHGGYLLLTGWGDEAECKHQPDRENFDLTLDGHDDVTIILPCRFDGCKVNAYIGVDVIDLIQITPDESLEWGEVA